MVVARPEPGEVAPLCAMGRVAIPGLATDAVVERVVSRNADSLFGIFRVETDGSRTPVGFYATLLLSDDGATAVRETTLDRANPDDVHMVPTGVRPAAIFMWAVVAKGLFEKTLPLYALAMGPLYTEVPLLTWAATDDGRRLINRRGFVASEGGVSAYDRSKDAQRAKEAA